MQGSATLTLAESVVLRGPRRGGAALQAQHAADLLDQSLLLESELPMFAMSQNFVSYCTSFGLSTMSYLDFGHAVHPHTVHLCADKQCIHCLAPEKI